MVFFLKWPCRSFGGDYDPFPKKWVPPESSHYFINNLYDTFDVKPLNQCNGRVLCFRRAWSVVHIDSF
jgi:hypothetical protein